MKKLEFLIVVLTLFLFQNTFPQEITIIPNGTLNNSDTALVTGNYVRIREKPSLDGKIITMVNKDTPVTIIKRGKDIIDIKGSKNYWYNIKVEESGIEGWMFGAFLEKKETKKVIHVNKELLSTKTSSPEAKIKNLGTISEGPSIITIGDLNNNGTEEIIFLNIEHNKSYGNITGYEYSEANFKNIYTTKIRSSSVNNLKIFKPGKTNQSIIVLEKDNSSDLYTYDIERNRLRLFYKLQTPILSFGKLDGKDDYFIYLKKNKLIDNDGSVTFYVNISKIAYKGSKITLKNKATYNKPLPVKKMIAFDINNDGNDEIICEIGGKNNGGGIVVLGFKNEKIYKILNSGINTYNDSQFLYMWGTNVKNIPMLILYTTNPLKRNEINNSFGFLYIHIQGNLLTVDKFIPINNILDNINNERKVLKNAENRFIIIDYNTESKIYNLKNPPL